MSDTAIAPPTRREQVNGLAGTIEETSLAQAAKRVAEGDPNRALVEAVARALSATGYLALREIQVEIDCDIAVLWGRVPNYHQKQLAQAVAQKVVGVRGIANGIEVVCCH